MTAKCKVKLEISLNILTTFLLQAGYRGTGKSHSVYFRFNQVFLVKPVGQVVLYQNLAGKLRLSNQRINTHLELP